MARTTSGDTTHAATAPELASIQDSFAGILARWSTAGIQDVILSRAQVDIGPAAMTVLHVLVRAGGSARPSHVAQQTGTGASNVSKVLVRMEDKGLVVRTADPADQRAVSVTVTPAGRRAHRAIVDMSNGMLAELLDGWSRADVEQFSTLLARYAEALQSAVFR